MFEIELRKLCKKFSIRAISEENSLEAQKEGNLPHSIPYEIAQSLKITHQYCDPTRAKRNELGIRQETCIEISQFPDVVDEDFFNSEVAKSHQKREGYWLQEIGKQNFWPTLLICGTSHVDSVARQASGLGLKNQILYKDWSALGNY